MRSRGNKGRIKNSKSREQAHERTPRMRRMTCEPGAEAAEVKAEEEPKKKSGFGWS